MSNLPEPEQTPNGPAYEGRLLERTDEDVADQGASFDITTLFSRRTVLSLVGLGVGSVALAGCAADASSTSSVTSTGEIPDETAGPYPGDGSNGPNALEDSGIVRSDITSSVGGGLTAAGVPLTFTLALTDMANNDAPFESVAVYAWHCDAAGLYSLYSSGVENETYLRGVQVADSSGEVTFTSIVPGCYAGRWTHIHFEVYPDLASISSASNAIATSQLALPAAMLDNVYALPTYDGSASNLAQISLATDNVFSDDDAALQLATVTGSMDSGYRASLAVRVDTNTTPSAGAAPPGGGRP